MKKEEGVKLTLNKKWIVFLFFTSLLVFCVCEIFLLYLNVPWQIGIIKGFSCIAQISFSILGVSFLIEYSTLRKISKDTMEEMKDCIVNHTSQVKYIKENYSEDMKRQLLLMSYMKQDYDTFSIINNSDKSSLLSFEKIIEELISCVYYDKDETTVIYEFCEDYISKKINRKIIIKNLYNVDYNFTTRSSFNNISIKGKTVDSFKLLKLNINGEDIEEKKLQEFIREGNCLGKDTTYTQHKTLHIPTNCCKETFIDYSLELKLPKNDKQSLITTTTPVRNFSHSIILKKNKELRDADINVFSLAKAIGIKNEKFVSNITSDDKTMKVFNIESSTWLFPGDGYTILLK